MNRKHWFWVCAAIVMAAVFESCSLLYGRLVDSMAVYFLIGFLSWCLINDEVKPAQRLISGMLILSASILLVIFFAEQEWLSDILKGYNLFVLLALHLGIYLIGMRSARLMMKVQNNDHYRKFLKR